MMLLLLLATQAQASSYYFVDSFVKGIGRGGAMVAGADDLSAQYYNPAALVNLEQPQLMVNVWTVGQSVEFDRADEPGPDGQMGTGDDYLYDPVTNEAPWIIEPTIQFGAPLGGLSDALKNTSVALGLYLPTSPNLSFDPNGPQRYSLISAQVIQGYVGPSVSQRFTPWLTAGAGFSYTFLGVKQSLNSLALIQGMNSETLDDTTGGNDITIALDTMDSVEFTGNFGLLVEPTKWMDIGLSVQPSVGYESVGTMTATFNPTHLFTNELQDDDGACLSTDGGEEDCVFVDDEVTVLVKIPWIFRGGIQVHPSDTTRIELAGTYTRWSSLDELRVTDVDLTLTDKPDGGLLDEDIVVTDDIVLKTGFVDAFSVRLGGDVQVADPVTIRAGVNYDSSAIPTTYQGQSIIDGPKVGFGAGATVKVGKRVAFDLGLADQIIFARDITDSELHAVVVETEILPPYPTTVTEGKIIGNGTLKSNVFYGGVGATVFFGKGS